MHLSFQILCISSLCSHSYDRKLVDEFSLGSSTDSNQKDGWHINAVEKKKDWIRIIMEAENGRRWHEEVESCLLW